MILLLTYFSTVIEQMQFQVKLEVIIVVLG